MSPDGDTTAPGRPTVSVIVPTHRRSELLAEALDGVLAQERAPDEVLVVDDAADPPSARVVAERAGGPVAVRLVDAPAVDGSGGASASRNRGAAEASGDVLAFLDDDDRWLPGHLAASLDALHDDVDFVVTWLAVDEDGELVVHRRPPAELGARDVVVTNPGVTGSNLVIRKAAFDAVGGYDPELWVSNDKDLLVRLLDARLRYAVVTEPHVVKRLHAGERLSDVTGRREAGIQRYLDKHRHRMGRQQHRELRARLVESRRLRSTGTRQRVVLAAQELWLLGPVGIWRARRRGELRVPIPSIVRTRSRPARDAA